MALTKEQLEREITIARAAAEAGADASAITGPVSDALTAGPVKVGPITLQPWNIGTYLVQQEIIRRIGARAARNAALIKAFDEGALSEISEDVFLVEKDGEMIATARMIYAFSDSQAAMKVLKTGLDNYDEKVMEIAAAVGMQWLGKLAEKVNELVTEGTATIPGGNASNPPGTGS